MFSVVGHSTLGFGKWVFSIPVPNRMYIPCYTVRSLSSTIFKEALSSPYFLIRYPTNLMQLLKFPHFLAKVALYCWLITMSWTTQYHMPASICFYLLMYYYSRNYCRSYPIKRFKTPKVLLLKSREQTMGLNKPVHIGSSHFLLKLPFGAFLKWDIPKNHWKNGAFFQLWNHWLFPGIPHFEKASNPNRSHSLPWFLVIKCYKLLFCIIVTPCYSIPNVPCFCPVSGAAAPVTTRANGKAWVAWLRASPVGNPTGTDERNWKP